MSAAAQCLAVVAAGLLIRPVIRPVGRVLPIVRRWGVWCNCRSLLRRTMFPRFLRSGVGAQMKSKPKKKRIVERWSEEREKRTRKAGEKDQVPNLSRSNGGCGGPGRRGAALDRVMLTIIQSILGAVQISRGPPSSTERNMRRLGNSQARQACRWLV